jgi:hypothetical protein
VKPNSQRIVNRPSVRASTLSLPSISMDRCRIQVSSWITLRCAREVSIAMWKYILAWFPMVAIAIANDVLRESSYGKRLSELAAHQVSTLTAVILFGVYVWSVVRIWRPASAAQAIAVGLLWLAMTTAFELLFGHYVAGHSWQRLLLDYNLLAGHIWLLVLVWIALAPYLFFRIME